MDQRASAIGEAEYHRLNFADGLRYN
jgi:hypothetical protein